MIATAQHNGFGHEALFYEGPSGFLTEVGAFVREGVERDEALLVAVTLEKADMLRAQLGPLARAILFEDMVEIGRNPARILPVWSDFVAEQTAAGRAFRGVGEPAWGSRSAEELAECARHEALLNLAFTHGVAWRLGCPYDRADLDPSVLDEARRTHPVVSVDGSREVSPLFRGTQAAEEPFDEPLAEPLEPTRRLTFTGPDDLGRVRTLVRTFAGQAGLGDARIDDLVLATDEVAANSLRHGGGRGVLRVWRRERELVCEVADPGRFDAPLAGRERPMAERATGMGLWIANQVCDLVEVRSTPDGTVVRLHMRR